MRTVAIAVMAALSGCTTWTTIRDYDERIPGGSVELRGDHLLGTVQVETGFRGDLAVSLNLDRMCRFGRLPRVQHVIERRRELTSLGRASLFVGLGLEVGSRFLFATPLVLAAAVFQLVPVIAMASEPRRDRSVTDEPEPEAAITSCVATDVTVGELTLTTPWGATYAQPVELTGDAHFPIDWLAAPTDDAQLFGRYTLRLEHGERAVGWTPSEADRAMIQNAVSEAHERPSDPWLRPEVE